MAGSFPASGLHKGAVFCSAATWWVLAARKGSLFVVCPLICQAENRHRADIPVPWAEALRVGCPDGAVVRCRPVLRSSVPCLSCRGQFSHSLTERILSTLLAELRCRAQEDALAPHSMKIPLRHRGRFQTSVSCSGAFQLPALRPEPRSPRALHFF